MKKIQTMQEDLCGFFDEIKKAATRVKLKVFIGG
jgi:hypothetical protein